MTALRESLMCPITLEILQDPLMCTSCTTSFSLTAILQHLQRRGVCPICRADLVQGRSLVPNRALAQALPYMQGVVRQAEHGEYAARQAESGMAFVYEEPFKMFFTGSFGAGKSTAINMLVDPTGASVVSQEGDGARGQTQNVQLVFPADGNAGTLMHHGRPVQVQVFDSPGFGDPDRSESDLMRELSRATLHVAQGIDAIIHVLKKGRMTNGDRNLPELLLSGLAHNDEHRRELASRWVFLVTHDSQRRATDMVTLEQFRGEMKAFFPEILHEAIDRCMFVENGQGATRSPYGDAEANKNKLLDHIAQARRVYHRVYRSPELDEMIAGIFREMLVRWEDVSASFPNMEAHELSSLLQHFKAVVRANRFLEMSSATVSNQEFCNYWNNMNLATRDHIAGRFTRDVLNAVEQAAESGWRRKLRGMPGGCCLQ